METARLVDLKDIAVRQHGALEKVFETLATNARTHRLPVSGTAEEKAPASSETVAATPGSARGTPFDTFFSSEEESISVMTRRVHVDVVVDVDATGRTARVVSETVRRVRSFATPPAPFLESSPPRRAGGAVADGGASGPEMSRMEARFAASEANEGIHPYGRAYAAIAGSSGPRARVPGTARGREPRTVEAKLRAAGDAARRARQPWHPPSGWSPERNPKHERV